MEDKELETFHEMQEKLRNSEIQKEDIFVQKNELQKLGVSVNHFVENVILPFLGAPWVMITDRSSIYDFCGGTEGKEEMLQLIEKVYGVDVSSVEDGIVADVIAYILSKKKYLKRKKGI